MLQGDYGDSLFTGVPFKEKFAQIWQHIWLYTKPKQRKGLSR